MFATFFNVDEKFVMNFLKPISLIQNKILKGKLENF